MSAYVAFLCNIRTYVINLINAVQFPNVLWSWLLLATHCLNISVHAAVEHIFEVVIEGVRSLPQGEDFVWGEADCFIQYHFPSQEKQYNQLQGKSAMDRCYNN